MAISAGTVVADAKMNMRGFTKDLDRMKSRGASAARKIGDSFKNVGSRLRSTGMAMSAAITAPLVGAGTLALKTAADYESLRQSMNALNGSAAEGARQFNRLKQFSAETPFQLKDLARAQNMLQGFGLSADEAFTSMKQIGDIAAITGGDIQSIGMAFGQAAAEGRLMTRDIRQLINQGVPATELLAKSMGVAQDQVFDLAEQGKISFKDLQNAFQMATSEGGKFANGMKRQANTLGGIWSTFKDNFSMTMGTIGQELAKAFNIKDLSRSIIQNLKIFREWFSSLSDGAKRLGFTIAAVLGAGGPALVALGAMATAIGALISPVGAVIAAIGGLAAAVVYVWDNWKAVKERISNVTWWRNTLVKMVQLLVEYNPVSLLIKGINQLLDYLGAVKIPNFYEGLADGLGKLRDDTVEYKHEFGSMWQAVKNAAAEATGLDFSIGLGGDKATENMLPENVVSQWATVTSQIQNGFNPALRQTNAISQKTLQGFSQLMWWTRSIGNEGSSQIKKVSQAAQTVGQSLGRMFNQAVLHGKNFMGVLKNIIKQLASRVFVQGITAIITGGSSLVAGSIGSAIFGGLFHGGGMVPGTGDRMIRAQGGEMVLTQSQQRALGSMMGGGGTTVNPRAIGKEIGKQLDRRLQKLGPEDIYAMNAKGSRGY